MNKITLWYFVCLCFGIGLSACSDTTATQEEIINNPADVIGKYAGFDFETVKEYSVLINTTNVSNTAADGTYIEIFKSNPLDTAGLFLPDYEENRIFKGLTDSNGELECKLNPPTSTDSLYVITYKIGLPQITTVALSGNFIDVEIGGSVQTKSQTKSSVKVDNVPDVSTNNGYYVLGSWGKKGLPVYLESQDDVLSNDFLERIDASVPETKALTETHPEFLQNSEDANVVMVEDGEVWVTFVHEGAGWKNALGYYTYPTGNPPVSESDIQDLTIIFPNVSMGNKDELQSGNKVQLLYLDQAKSEYAKLFPAGTSIGWFLVASGWQDGKREVKNKNYTHYTTTTLNVENSADLQKHCVVLFDEQTERYVIAFEDVSRDSNSCDNDFNDAIFYATFNPITAVESNNYQVVDDSAADTDGDGSHDEFDQYPNDASKAFNNYYPAENQFGSLAFEDLWPGKGDYDFNDLVMDYNFNQITNANNEVVEINSKLILKALGASKRNAFGFSIDMSPSSVTQISGQDITGTWLDLAENGTENSQSKATIICFDDPYNVIQHPGTGSGVNTDPSAPYATPDTLNVVISLNNAVSIDQFDTPPYNPFIIVDKERGKEVHLQNYAPTDLADQSYFGTHDDDSNASLNKYYLSDQYLPWAINLPVSFDYPNEKKSILDTYLQFDTWAVNKGETNTDWYMNLAGYRNSSNIYSK